MASVSLAWGRIVMPWVRAGIIGRLLTCLPVMLTHSWDFYKDRPRYSYMYSLCGTVWASNQDGGWVAKLILQKRHGGEFAIFLRSETGSWHSATCPWRVVDTALVPVRETAKHRCHLFIHIQGHSWSASGCCLGSFNILISPYLERGSPCAKSLTWVWHQLPF